MTVRLTVKTVKMHISGILVMPGLDPGIHHSSIKFFLCWMDGRVKPGHDETRNG
jgi:hypothetical protein